MGVEKTMNRKPMIMVATLVALVMAAAGCMGPAAPQNRSFTVKEYEFAFSVPTMEVNQNDVLTITVTNNGTMEHTFTIDAYSINEVLSVNETATVHLVATVKGSFEYYCAVSGHKAAGMVGTLKVN